MRCSLLPPPRQRSLLHLLQLRLAAVGGGVRLQAPRPCLHLHLHLQQPQLPGPLDGPLLRLLHLPRRLVATAAMAAMVPLLMLGTAHGAKLCQQLPLRLPPPTVLLLAMAATQRLAVAATRLHQAGDTVCLQREGMEQPQQLLLLVATDSGRQLVGARRAVEPAASLCGRQHDVL